MAKQKRKTGLGSLLSKALSRRLFGGGGGKAIVVVNPSARPVTVVGKDVTSISKSGSVRKIKVRRKAVRSVGKKVVAPKKVKRVYKAKKRKSHKRGKR